MSKKIGNGMKVTVILCVAILAAFLLMPIVKGRVQSVDDFQNYIKGFGIFGPIFLTVFQAFQVVIPAMPGNIGCAAGAISFGTLTGFLCSYVGICAGSFLAYLLGRRYGKAILMALFSKEMYEKWEKRIAESRSFVLFFFIAILLPVFPDDFLCYFSGMMRMDQRKFLWIILLGKPWVILAYSVGFGLLG